MDCAAHGPFSDIDERVRLFDDLLSLITSAAFTTAPRRWCSDSSHARHFRSPSGRRRLLQSIPAR